MMKKLINMRQDGFTLIEILMAVLIIVILALVGITQFNNFSADAKNAATKSNLSILRNAIGTMNALERVRCQKTTLLFPDITTIANNDITGCLSLPATVPAAGVSCSPVTLIDPATGATYDTASGDCTNAFTAGAGAAGHYMALIPLVDHPFVQNGIPTNPWSGALATRLSNAVIKDNSPAAATSVCEDAPNDTFGAMANASECGTGAGAGPHGGTAMAANNAGAGLLQAGWCYCQDTGQIWANSANNDGLTGTTGNESTF
jgi:prepilin-type N-terminal cleavage/methylation domain-containing protein